MPWSWYFEILGVFFGGDRHLRVNDHGFIGNHREGVWEEVHGHCQGPG